MVETVRELIKRHEGFKDKVYLDSLGYPTIGYGHCFMPGSFLPKEILDAIFEYDYSIAENGYNSLGYDLDPVRKSAIIDLIFNMGLPRFKGFKLMNAALARKDFVRAAEELKNSKYYTQTGTRAEEIRNMILNG